MFKYHVVVGNHEIHGFSMTYDGAKEAAIISIKWLWQLFGWEPAKWEVKSDHVDNGGITWRA